MQYFHSALSYHLALIVGLIPYIMEAHNMNDIYKADLISYC